MYNHKTYISADDPAFYIVHGSSDVLIPYLQAKNFYDKLVPVIGANNANYKLLSYAGHAVAAFSTSSNLSLLVDFLNTHLK